MSREQAIRRALLVVNKTTIRMQVRGTTKVIQLHAGLHQLLQIRAIVRNLSWRRSPNCSFISSFDLSPHTHESCTVPFYRYLSVTLLWEHRSHENPCLQAGPRYSRKRTEGYWVDPDRCGATIPENLVIELLDLKIPMQAILPIQRKSRF